MGILDAPAVSPAAFANVVPSPFAMQPWASAFATRDTAPASITVVSDSTAEGVGITSLNNRWIERLRDSLRTRFPVTGISAGGQPDYIPAYYDTQGAIQAAGPALTAGVTKSTSWGLGRRAGVLPSTNTTDTITFTLTNCTRFKVLVAKNAASTIGITVDGGTENQIALAQTNAGGFVAFDSGTLTAGTHTVVCRRVSGGTVTVEGILRYGANEDSKGVRVLDSAHSGQANSHFGGATAWAASCGVEQPDLVIHGLIYNDYLNRVSTAQFPGYVTAIRDAIRAAATGKTPSYLFLILPEPQYTSGTPAAATWDWYVQQIKQIAAADPLKLSAVLDLSQRIPKWYSGSTFGLVQSDKIHPTDKGAAWVADAVERYITRV